ncbi:MAG: plastocyanin/azurin family copper-binding protein [Schleiferiaceae bacterium]|nr:plastocyanin/azurin family copper-binding protein [Schleiferiaceae bacterium]
MKRIALFAAAAMLMAACSGGGNAPANQETQEAPAEQESTEKAPAQEETMEETMEEADTVALSLSTTGETMNTMAYEPKRLSVPAGATVKLTMENTASAEAMIHNAVFIQIGKQMDVINAGAKVGKDGGFVPEDHPAVIAATDLAQPGETVELTFTAPAKAGNYQYICTYPGHQSMKGTLIVK